MGINTVDVIFEITIDGNRLDALTINQLTELIGNTKQSVYSLINQKNTKGENYLDVCYPFPNSKSKLNTGPMFVLLNKKGRDYLNKNLRKKKKKLQKKSNVPIEDTEHFFLRQFKDFLGKTVEFNSQYLEMAVGIENLFSRNLITKAFVEVSKSPHKKNTFKLITLAYMLRKSEIERWSSK